MAVTAHAYTKAIDSLAQKKVDLDSDTIKVMLLSAYTIGTTQDTAQYVAAIKAVATEAVGTGYTAGGATLTSVTWAQSGRVFAFDAADVSWNTAGGSLAAAYAVFYDATPGTDATNPVLAFWDFAGTQTATNGIFTLGSDVAGLLTFTGA